MTYKNEGVESKPLNRSLDVQSSNVDNGGDMYYNGNTDDGKDNSDGDDNYGNHNDDSTDIEGCYEDNSQEDDHGIIDGRGNKGEYNSCCDLGGFHDEYSHRYSSRNSNG